MLALALVLLALPGRAQQTAPPPTGVLGPDYFHEVFEKDRGKFYPLTPSTTVVDANADLIVSFHPPATTNAVSPGLSWEQVTNALDFVRDNLRQRAQFAMDLARLQSGAEAEFSARLSNFNRSSLQQLRQIRARAKLDEAEWDRILDGDFDGRPGNRPWLNFARWLTNRMETVQRELAQFAADHTVQVTVQASLLPRSGAEHPLAIPFYNKIEEGEYRPVDRLGLRMNEAERLEFEAKLRAAQIGAGMANEIRTNSAQFKQYLRAKLGEVRQKLDDLARLLESEAADWKADFTHSQTAQALEKLAGDESVTNTVRTAAGALREELGQFNEDFRQASALYTKVNKLIGQLQRAEAADLLEAFTAIQQIVAQLGELNTAGAGLLGNVARWPERLQRAVTHAEIVGPFVAEEMRSQVLPATMRAFVEDFAKQFPATAAAVEFAARVLGAARSDGGAAGAGEIIASVGNEPIWKNITEALPATVRLTRAGLAPGDGIHLQVNYRKPGTNGVPGPIVATDEYNLETVLMGWHRKFDASLIFARGMRGDDEEQQWKPNVAATVTWHFRYRDESNPFHQFWNGLDPGLGLHLASLDQGEDSVEFGAGVNLSLWDGVLQGGYGFNLNNDERPYVFFGLGLLQTLEKAKALRH